MNETDRFRARLLFYWKENEMYFGLRLLLYFIPMFILFLLLAIFWLGLFNLLLNLLV